MQAAELFDANLDLARSCRDHPFVQGIADGAVDRAASCVYVAQDATFLDAYVRAYDVGVAKAPDVQSMTAFKFLLTAGFDELDPHRGYAARLGRRPRRRFGPGDEGVTSTSCCGPPPLSRWAICAQP